MGSVKFERDSEEFRFFAEFYRFVQKYYIPEESQEYWDGLMEEMNALSKKYPSDFCRKMLIAYAGYLEEIFNDEEGRNGGKT